MHPHASICIYKEQVCYYSKYLNLNFKACNMAFALEITLLMLFAAVYGRDTEIVLLQLWNAEDNAEVPLSFKAFDQTVDLMLRKNDKIVAPQFRVWKHIDEDTEQELSELSNPVSCHYLHRDAFSSAAISLCKSGGMHGLVFLENVTLEITPLRDQDSSLFDTRYIRKRSRNFGEPHIVKRALGPVMSFHDQPKYHEWSSNDVIEPGEKLEKFGNNNIGANEALTLELAVFFDEAGYQLFSPFFSRNDEEVRDMLLAYVNGVQAIYHHPSLGANVDISLVRLEMMQRQPRDLPHHDGERGKLLDSFCDYAMRKNPDTYHPNHWDMGLYVSGLDFYAMEDGRKNSATMGLAVVGGLCIDQYSCVIAEFGVTNQFGKPFPSAGFTSVYIAAHEIGHNLGMHHDSTNNACPKDGYIMSPSRGTHGETIWSDCSRDVAQRLSYTKPCLLDRPTAQSDPRLDHSRLYDLPGREWNGKKQCELLLRDKDANVATLYRACESLQCRTPHRSGYYFAGPALDGTYCAPGKECRGGECKNALQMHPGDQNPFIQPGGWSQWQTGACRSGCLSRSTGAQTRRRTCNEPTPRNTEVGCQGLHYDVVLCEDTRLCKKKRKTANEFASLKCEDFSMMLKELDGKGGGLQAPHENERPWMACAIFCRRKGIASYYTPRVELNDLGLDPYFPDGTWCHAEEGQNYFCRQHHCLPDSFRFEKILMQNGQRIDEDVDFGPQNAHPGDLKLDDQIVRYFSLGEDGLPLLTSLSHSVGFPPDEDEWIDKDYVEFAKTTGEVFDDVGKEEVA